jgi:pyruvate/2-oxoglutarate dehydrogenase complex dihydrolipoamide acyltransferase (E2) component
VRATPAARRKAREQGLDLARVKAQTGAAVVTEEVLNAFLDGQAS